MRCCSGDAPFTLHPSSIAHCICPGHGRLALGAVMLPSFPTPLPSLTLAVGVLLFSTLLALLSAHGQVSANGATRVVKNERAGPYELQVGILPGNPRVGNLHLSILVANSADGVPIINAAVMVAAVGPPDAANVGPVPAVTSLGSLQYYEADISLDTVGSWSIFIDVNSGLGEATLELPLEVTEGGGISLAFVAAVAIALLALSIWLWDRIRRVRRRRGQTA